MRISNDELFMSIAYLLSQRSTCRRRKVGCVIVDESNLILGTGYNGVPVHEPHCIDEPCEGADLPSGSGLDICAAVHAEQNALMQTADVQRIHTIYTTAQPCSHCSKMIANTRCKRVIYMEPYPGGTMYGDIRYDRMSECLIKGHLPITTSY